MAQLRPMLLMGLLVLAYLMWIEWKKDYGVQPQAQPATELANNSSVTNTLDDASIPAPPDNSIPTVGDLPEPDSGTTSMNPDTGSQAVMTGNNTLMTITTDVLEVKIDLVGGTLVSARLLDYPVKPEVQEIKVDLFNIDGPELFIAQSGLLSLTTAPNHTSTYHANAMQYTLGQNSEEIRVPLTWEDENGIRVTKTFIFKRGKYDIAVRHTLSNQSGQNWSGSRYEQLQRSVIADKDDGGFTNPGRYSFFGIGMYSPDEKFEKVDFEDIASEPFKRSFSGGWLSMVQHYFFAAWIPPANEVNSYSTSIHSPNGFPRYIARAVSPLVEVSVGASHEFESRLYVGPKLQDQIEEVAPGLGHTVNYGIFTVFSKPLFWLLSKIHSVVQNWGWAIVLLTVLIKLLFFKLTEAQYRSMARMRKLQPRIEQLKERYGDDRQRMSQAMMEMYKTEKVNPLGGCLPILVQIPIFIALYWVLLESVELRQAPFILWIDNLTARDPYFVLPVLNAAFMMLTQRLTPTAGMDPLQRKIMQFMPIGFSFMFAFFPAGLVLYWATNAGLSLAQQWCITRKIEAAP
ncbi:MAG: membrane protein insertase YidC [Gammaproteobacteria bacterium]|nr:membrane protein insertase YidC [Gammaproteobacteria bacterium]